MISTISTRLHVIKNLPIQLYLQWSCSLYATLILFNFTLHYMSNRVTATSILSSPQALPSASSQRYEVLERKLKFGRGERAVAWSADIRKQSDTKTFKKLLKTYFLEATYYNWPLCNAPLFNTDVTGAVKMPHLFFVFLFLYFYQYPSSRVRLYTICSFAFVNFQTLVIFDIKN